MRYTYALIALCLLSAVALAFSLAFLPSGSLDSNSGSQDVRGISILIVGDPFAPILEQEASGLLAPLGLTANFERAGYDAIREIILAEKSLPSESFDIVAFDVVWTSEFAKRGALISIDGFYRDDPQGIRLDEFLEPALDGIRADGALYGLPIQPHAELLWYRTDLLAQSGIEPPQTPDQLLEVARRLHRPDDGVYGIVWNAQRGSALGQTVAHMYAAFGLRMLDDQGLPQLDQADAEKVAQFLKDLVAVSPPDILSTAWDQRRRRFIAGQAALTYEWGARMGEGLRSPDSQVGGKVQAYPPPVLAGIPPVASFGTWCLGIPSGLSRERQQRAWRAIAAICGMEGARRMVQAGNAGVPKRILLDDDELGENFAGLFGVMRDLHDLQAFSPHVRPSIPQWNDLCIILGDVFHDVLRGDLEPGKAPALAQERALILWEQGYD